MFMLPHNIITLQTIIKSDPTVPENIELEIMKLCRTKNIKRRLGNVSDLGRIWEVSTKTARGYAKKFGIYEKKYSRRKIRYDLDEAERVNLEDFGLVDE